MTTAVVALTGGIASGKTAVSNRFAELGVPVIDTDIIARELVAKGQPALQAIADTLGIHFINEDGTLNRGRLRDKVFSDSSKRLALEAILHPAIQAEVLRRLNKVSADYCIVVVPLLVGSKLLDIADRALVIDVPVQVQLDRLMKRDKLSRHQAMAAIDAQASREERLNIADDVIENSASFEELSKRVDEMHETYADGFGKR